MLAWLDLININGKCNFLSSEFWEFVLELFILIEFIVQ
jgi:hypothetical protein